MPLDEQADDRILLRAVAGGDRHAFRLFYRRHSGRLLAMMRHICRGNGQLAEDLLQDAFLLVWRKAGTFDPSRGDVAGWLFTICRHRAIDHHRRQRPTEELDDREPGPAVSSSRDLRISLDQAMAGLKDAERQALRLAYYGGLTYEETAARLAIPLGTLKSRIRSGLRKLAAKMGSS